MGGEEAQRGAQRGADEGAGKGDQQADADGGEQPAQHVAAKLVGAEGVVPDAAEQRGRREARAQVLAW